MLKNYKPRKAKCVFGKHDNPVEPNQTMSVSDMLVAYTKGMPLPQNMGYSYDENISIDDVGYSIGDRLEAIDYLNSVNQRAALAKMHAEKAKQLAAENTENTSSDVSE